MLSHKGTGNESKRHSGQLLVSLRDIASAKVIKNRGLVAVGQPVNQKKACGDVLAGITELSLFDLAKSL
jgi:hypothetical protein